MTRIVDNRCRGLVVVYNLDEGGNGIIHTCLGEVLVQIDIETGFGELRGHQFGVVDGIAEGTLFVFVVTDYKGITVKVVGDVIGIAVRCKHQSRKQCKCQKKANKISDSERAFLHFNILILLVYYQLYHIIAHRGIGLGNESEGNRPVGDAGLGVGGGLAG